MAKKGFLLLFLGCFFSEGRYRVCSITLNSSDEIEVFQEELGFEDFDYTELAPSLENPSDEGGGHWFLNSCESNTRCDVMVISGHFGGLFFGERHNHVLPVEIMERYSCARTCDNLLFDVKEVFLFGCNTLAGKGGGGRTPEEYLQVLLHHNMTRSMAQTVVATRYLPFGLSFKNKMQLIFSGRSHIYGFDNLSPFGHQIRTPLKSYFQKIRKRYGSYKKYLDQKKLRDKNPLLMNTLGGTVTETRGLSLSDRSFSDFFNMCALYSPQISEEKGLSYIRSLMEAGKGPMGFASIRHFVQNRSPFQGTVARSAFRNIKNSFKGEFYPLYGQISPRLPYVRIQFLNFLNLFGWLPGDFYRSEIKKQAHRMLTRPNTELYDLTSALALNEQLSYTDLGLVVGDFKPEFYSDIWSALILQNLNVTHYLAHRRLMNLCLKNLHEDPPLLCYQVLKSLGHLRVNDSLVVQRLRQFLNAPDEGLVYYSLYAFAYSGLRGASLHKEIASKVTHPNRWIRIQAVRTLGLLGSSDEEAVGILMHSLARSHQDTEMMVELLKALKNMPSAHQSVAHLVRDQHLLLHPEESLRQAALPFANP